MITDRSAFTSPFISRQSTNSFFFASPVGIFVFELASRNPPITTTPIAAAAAMLIVRLFHRDFLPSAVTAFPPLHSLHRACVAPHPPPPAPIKPPPPGRSSVQLSLLACQKCFRSSPTQNIFSLRTSRSAAAPPVLYSRLPNPDPAPPTNPAKAARPALAPQIASQTSAPMR